MIKLKKNLFEGDGPLTQGFGENPDWYSPYGLKGHNGIDYGIPTGAKLYSAINGTVIEVLYDAPGYGKYIKIENDECGVLYGHMKTLSPISVGTKVVAGQEIGLSGDTGNSTGPHLHFGVFPKPRDRSNGYAGYIDPFGPEVEWVDELNGMDELKECELEKFRYKTERNECREQRDKERYEYGKTLSEKDKMIEQLQKTHAELTAQLSSARNMITDTQNEAKSLRERCTTLEGQIKVSEIAKTEEIDVLQKIIDKQADSMREKDENIKKLKQDLKDGLKSYSKWELFLALFGKR